MLRRSVLNVVDVGWLACSVHVNLPAWQRDTAKRSLPVRILDSDQEVRKTRAVLGCGVPADLVCPRILKTRSRGTLGTRRILPTETPTQKHHSEVPSGGGQARSELPPCNGSDQDTAPRRPPGTAAIPEGAGPQIRAWHLLIRTYIRKLGEWNLLTRTYIRKLNYTFEFDFWAVLRPQLGQGPLPTSPG